MKTRYVKPAIEITEMNTAYTLLSGSDPAASTVGIFDIDATDDAMSKENDFDLWSEEE